MTKLLKTLLHNYGLLYITMNKLAQDRPGINGISFAEYDERLGEIEKDEPVLLVKISEDGETKFLEDGNHKFQIQNLKDEVVGKLNVLELPEDEFYFFGAFRPGLFDLTKELPSFIYGMGTIHAYALFENYLSEIIKQRYLKHPELMGKNKQLDYAEVIECSSKDEIIEKMVNKEVRDLFYLPIQAILQIMREKLGFRKLTTEFDDDLLKISLIRNCLVHNGGKVDLKLARAYPENHQIDKELTITKCSVEKKIRILRKFCYEVDKIIVNHA